METINDLLKALDNKVPASIAKRLDGLNKLNQKLETAKAENDENPTAESQEQLDEIIEFIKDTQEDLKEDLRVLVENKREAEEKNRQTIAKKEEEEKKARLEERKKNEAKKKEELEREELEKAKLKEEEEEKAKKKAEEEQKEKEKKSSGIGLGTILLGGALLIFSAGAINYFGKKR